MNESELVAEIQGITETARGAETIETYDGFVLGRLGKLVGFDVAFIVRGSEPGKVAPGFDNSVRRACAESWPVFARELEPFVRHVLARRGVGIDLAFFGPADLARRTYYREIMCPLHGRSTLITYVSRRGRVQAKLVLGRKRGASDFTERDQAVVEALVPTLSLCEAALPKLAAPPSDGALGALTPREREVMQYLQLGFTNAEIALACGTSPATVRNQLVSVFRKLGASTRAEAVALALRPHGE